MFLTGADIRIQDADGNDVTEDVNLNTTIFEAALVDDKTLLTAPIVSTKQNFEVWFYDLNSKSWSKGFDLSRDEIELMQQNKDIKLHKKFSFKPYVIVVKQDENYWTTKRLKFEDLESGTVVVKANFEQESESDLTRTLSKVDFTQTDSGELVALRKCKKVDGVLECEVKYPKVFDTVSEITLIDAVKKEINKILQSLSS